MAFARRKAARAQADLVELINRRRRQLHVHAVLYYHLDTTLVTDAIYDAWSKDLVTLHANNPELIRQGYEYAMFEDWTGDTGMHLRVTDQTYAMAATLLRLQEKRTP